jgi:lipoate-protein ligase A
MAIVSKIMHTRDVDPYRNLALEEYLLDHVGQEEMIFYLWQNQNTVVIGKNQNPWKECRPDLLESEGGKLVRRITGGGAVFHDLGNLNFSFVTSRAIYDFKKQLGVILHAVQKLGIPAVFSGRNDLTVDGKKFSGNAFYLRSHTALHHGTLLFAADLDKLTRYLQVAHDKIRSKGIDSVRARVVNLSTYLPDLRVDAIVAALAQSFDEIYRTPFLLNENDIERPAVDKLTARYKSWEWTFGEAPEFDIEMEKRFAWGGIHLCLQLENARVKKGYVYSDAMDTTFIERIPAVLAGVPFKSADLAQAVRTLAVDEEKGALVEDIAGWLHKKGF